MTFISQSLTSVKHAFQDLFFPPICRHCQKVVDSPEKLPLICQPCLNSLSDLPNEVSEVEILNRIQPRFIDDIWIAFRYDDVIRIMLHAIKYQQMPKLGFKAGAHIGRRFPQEIAKFRKSIVLPVPLHPIRRKEREYNQSLWIAKGIFNEFPENVLENVLVRSRYTSTQTKLTRQKRQKNVRNAFEISDHSVIAGKSIVLVDDVITTGATLNECARILKKAGAETVVGVAAASPINEV